MRIHPKSRRRSQRKSTRPKTKAVQRPQKPPPSEETLQELHQDGGGFLSLLLARIGWKDLNSLQQRKHAAGRPVKDLSRGPALTHDPASLRFRHDNEPG